MKEMIKYLLLFAIVFQYNACSSKDENIVEMDLKLKDKTDSLDIFKAVKKKELFEIGFKTQVILKISK